MYYNDFYNALYIKALSVTKNSLSKQPAVYSTVWAVQRANIQDCPS